MPVVMPNDLLKSKEWQREWLAKRDAERKQPKGAAAILKAIEIKKSELQASEPDLSDRDAWTQVNKADPELYRRYCDAVIEGRP